jgi:phosphoglycerate dehydrogenase-like enzyme
MRRSPSRRGISWNAERLARLAPDAILINTSRGALVDTAALIDALKRGHLGGVGLDVYEREVGVFYADLSEQGLTDDVLARLLTFPRVIVTSHMGYLTWGSARRDRRGEARQPDRVRPGQPAHARAEPVSRLTTVARARDDEAVVRHARAVQQAFREVNDAGR